jgi:magnesium transporter
MPKYKKISAKIQELFLSGPKSKNAIRWLNIISPGKEELDYLRKIKKYNFDFRDLRSSYSQIQAERPLIEKRGNYYFLIFNFPAWHGNEIIPAEINFFLSHDFLATLHDGSLKGLNDFFNIAKKDESSLTIKNYPSAAVLLAELLGKLINDCYGIMDKNSVKINEMEKMIFAGEQKKSVVKILELEHNIINIRRIMLSHKNILKKLILLKSSIIPSSIIKSFYIELIEHTKKIWELSEGQKETIEALRRTNESLLDYKTNNIVKTLTIFSVIFTPLTFVASLFAMDVKGGMPFINQSNGFFTIVLSLSSIALLMILFFIRKKWL